MEERRVWRYSRFNHRYIATTAIDRLRERVRALLGFATVLVAMVPVALIGIAYSAFVELVIYGGR